MFTADSTTDLSSDQLLHVWGLRIVGGSFRSVGHCQAGGGELGIDESLVLVRYVESTEGFDLAREALIWVYAKGHSPADFPLVGPGQTLGSALLSRGWGMHLGRPRRTIVDAVINTFRMNLENRMRLDPLAPIFPKVDLPLRGARSSAVSSKLALPSKLSLVV